MKTLSLLVLGLWSASTAAQVPVVDAGGAVADRSPVLLAQAANPNNELVVSLYNQLEALQREVQTLRGIVEEQSFQLRKMETEQRDRYLDIDRRLSGLSGGSVPGAVPDSNAVPGGPGQMPPAQTGAGDPAASSRFEPAFNTNAPGNDNLPPVARNEAAPPVQSANPAGPGGAPGVAAGTPIDQMDDQELYRTALALLLEQNQYEESIRLFQSYIERFPQGRYLTNAYYWQGEALLLVARYDEARDVFNKILTDYPQDPKAAGAMLKLGVAYREMGDAALAMRTWQEIATRYPENLTEIGFAQDYLDQL